MLEGMTQLFGESFCEDRCDRTAFIELKTMGRLVAVPWRRQGVFIWCWVGVSTVKWMFSNLGYWRMEL